MKQITFSDQSLNEFSKLDKLIQLKLLDKIGEVCDGSMQLSKNAAIGRFRREGIDIYRHRIDDLRVYFEIIDEDVIYCRYILGEHTLSDFLYRFCLPVTDEQLTEGSGSFWKYLESFVNKK
ncbi:MAG: type II toxin-antitoxin system RelE/ParE family toxin [Puniceicoccales bacterium]|jgi:mRNA-degrading endonuclease RelE of RelBE toxin-antitoxin system|nr:type II toxin-antitoxin system RelE/ParE family toxin [Puniceicoccales bacterium]